LDERIYAPSFRFVTLAAQIGAHAPLVTMTAPVLEQLHARRADLPRSRSPAMTRLSAS
jgi:hypothetical protein